MSTITAGARPNYRSMTKPERSAWLRGLFALATVVFALQIVVLITLSRLGVGANATMTLVAAKPEDTHAASLSTLRSATNAAVAMYLRFSVDQEEQSTPLLVSDLVSVVCDANTICKPPKSLRSFGSRLAQSFASSGGSPVVFDLSDAETKTGLCKLWHNGELRAGAAVPLYRDRDLAGALVLCWPNGKRPADAINKLQAAAVELAGK